MTTQINLDQLLTDMTLEEKIGQMTQVETDSIEADAVAKLGIGSVVTLILTHRPAGDRWFVTIKMLLSVRGWEFP